MALFSGFLVQESVILHGNWVGKDGVFLNKNSVVMRSRSPFVDPGLFWRYSPMNLSLLLNIVGFASGAILEERGGVFGSYEVFASLARFLLLRYSIPPPMAIAATTTPIIE